LARPSGTPEREATRFWDFHTLNECRDLLFHVQEHQHTLLGISKFIAESGLELIGMEVDDGVRRKYLQRFRDDPAMVDLAHWHAFEQANPDTFREMYVFWVQRNVNASS
jgi:hypothetical protein